MTTKQIHIMLDMEYLDIRPTAQILSIGAYRLFSEDTWYNSIRTERMDGFTVSLETLNWWNQQLHQIKSEAFAGLTDIERALEQFVAWFPSEAIIWTRGGLDFAILRNAFFVVLGRDVPWNFRNERDQRTLMKLIEGKYWDKDKDKDSVVNPMEHHALWDALTQGRQLEIIMERMAGAGYEF